MPVRFFLFLVASASLASAGCVTVNDAGQKIGAITCVTGKVLKVDQSNSRAFFLDFCEDHRRCPFTVVVFPRHLRDVGDIRELEGKDIEIHGEVQQWMGKAEIVLRDARQLHGGSLPPVPKTYDVARQGKYNPGQFRKAKTSKSSTTKPKKATGPDELGIDVQEKPAEF
ncbi:MAG TPA: hypothetical protein VEG30_10050 [Terriglobales bacterium]|nr:hypothetical protein [Terriglobales bacterium]